MFESEWVNAKEFRQRLGIGRTTQWAMMKKGILRPPYHFCRVGTGKKSTLLFNLPACELAFLVYTQE
jgi:hypothetical protein